MEKYSHLGPVEIASQRKAFRVAIVAGVAAGLDAAAIGLVALVDLSLGAWFVAAVILSLAGAAAVGTGIMYGWREGNLAAYKQISIDVVLDVEAERVAE